jgi:hypothetical protein
MVERSLRMREARGSIPRTSILFSCIFSFMSADGSHEKEKKSTIRPVLSTTGGANSDCSVGRNCLRAEQGRTC